MEVHPSPSPAGREDDLGLGRWACGKGDVLGRSAELASFGSAIARDQLPGYPPKSPFFDALAPRILHRHVGGGWPGLCDRLVAIAAEVEARYAEPDSGAFLAELLDAISRGAFLPNSPLLVNAGEDHRAIFACFALDTRRPLSEFFELSRAVHDGMGGVGCAIEGSGADVAAFVQALDEDTGAHQAGRPRPASNAVTVDVNSEGAGALLSLSGRMRWTNLNWGVPDAFMHSVQAGLPVEVGLLTRLAESMHATGQPGVVFVDRIPRSSLEVAPPFAANVCGEAPLAADESGLLGSLNLLQFLGDGQQGPFLDEEALCRSVRLAVRFLDGMHDVHHHPATRLAANSLATRKIGVGVMGFAHLLPLLGIRYGDDASIRLASRIGNLMMRTARDESQRLSVIRGAAPAYRPVTGEPARRNALLVAIAGTATLCLLVGTTGGIEPIQGLALRTRVVGREIVTVDPILLLLAARQGLDVKETDRRLRCGELLSDVVGSDLARLFPVAHEVDGADHIRVQAAFQREIDGGITKTINCPPSTSTETIRDWIQLAWTEGCLGLTIYRGGTLDGEPASAVSGALS